MLGVRNFIDLIDYGRFTHPNVHVYISCTLPGRPGATHLYPHMYMYTTHTCNAHVHVHRTKKAMGGSVTFQEALRARLDLFRPSLKQVTEFVRLEMNPEKTLTPGVE